MTLPKNNLKFTAGPVKSKKYPVIKLLPVFSDQDAKSVARSLDRPDLEEKIESMKKSGAFRGIPGEMLNYSADGFILAGLGRFSSFSPELCGALFRRLGARVSRFKLAAFDIIFSDELKKAAESFDAVSRGKPAVVPAGIEATAKKRVGSSGAAKKSKPKKASGKTDDGQGAAADDDFEDEEESDARATPDYFFPVTLEEIVSQSVSCMIIGADPMDLLKKARARRKLNAGEIGIVAAGLSAKKIAAAIERGATSGRMVNGVRRIAALPGNRFTPDDCEQYARGLANEFKLKIEVFDSKKLQRIGCNGILSVGRGSRIPPRMIILKYKPEKVVRKGRISLVGKGITFDTGGISLKPSSEMHEMKYDMCGAAVVMHAIALIAARRLPIEVVALVGIAENMPGGNAIKPGDVYTAYNGLAVEVQNTDAEGRLVLGDVLAYAAKNIKPDTIIDFATLTGACVIALGHEAAAIMTPSEDLARRIETASQKSLDRSWRLPHWRSYGADLKSDIADARNIAGRPAGTVSAMRFLANFVPPEIEWAHVDIAGVAWRSKASGSQCKGPTGWGVRMMNQFFEDLL